MRQTSDDIYRLDLQNPKIPLSCPRCGKSRIVVLWHPGGLYGVAHKCPDGTEPVKVKFDTKAEAVEAWNRYCRGGEAGEGRGAGTGAPGACGSEQAGDGSAADPAGSGQD